MVNVLASSCLLALSYRDMEEYKEAKKDTVAELGDGSLWF